MDMVISGSGLIASGEYDNIKISGSGNLNGLIRCKSLHCSGAAKGEAEIECKNEIHTSGSAKFDKSIKCGELSVSGAFKCGGDLTVEKSLKTSGGTKCGGSVKAGSISVSGGLSIEGDAEAETVKVFGVLNCGGLLNAESIEIRFKDGMDIGSIGGSRINIYTEELSKRRIKLPLFSSLVKGASAVRVNNSIEGDIIALEGVVTPRVSGRIVAISDGCEIDLVQYSEQVEISPNAKVRKTEKI